MNNPRVGVLLAVILLIVLPASLYLAVRAWRMCGAIGPKWAARAARVVCVPVVGSAVLLAGAWVTWRLQASGWNSGSWTCVVCGESREEARWGGRTLWIGAPAHPEPLQATTAGFHGWYVRELDTPHEHQWRSVGCHDTGRGVACGGHELETVHWLTLQITDPALAHRFHAHFVPYLQPGSRLSLRELFRADDGLLMEHYGGREQLNRVERRELERRLRAWLEPEQ